MLFTGNIQAAEDAGVTLSSNFSSLQSTLTSYDNLADVLYNISSSNAQVESNLNATGLYNNIGNYIKIHFVSFLSNFAFGNR